VSLSPIPLPARPTKVLTPHRVTLPRSMISLTELVYLACLWPIWREFGWQIFKTLGADRRVKRSYAWFQVLICVLKFGAPFLL